MNETSVAVLIRHLSVLSNFIRFAMICLRKNCRVFQERFVISGFRKNRKIWGHGSISSKSLSRFVVLSDLLVAPQTHAQQWVLTIFINSSRLRLLPGHSKGNTLIKLIGIY